ncbi:MAG: Tol-Pal system beta propeller repeat protein TolB [Pseudomonadota bacterium]
MIKKRSHSWRHIEIRNLPKSRLVAIFCTFFLLCASFNARAQSLLTIEITSNQANAISIAVAPFGWNVNGLPQEDVAQIVADDLQRSGQFKPLRRADMLSRPTKPNEVLMPDWKILGVDYLVIGDIKPNGNGFGLDFSLYDIYKGTVVPLPANTLRTTDLRDGAHYISDLIYEKITGVRGAFSTEILYITVERVGKQATYKLQKADADGHRPRVILQSKDPILSPSWAPDGEHIAYVSFRTGRPAVYMQNLRTGQERQLTRFKGLNGAPDWSPDGRSMAMVLSKDGNPEIYSMDLASGQLKRLTNHYAIDTEPRWAPDGKSLVFTSNRGGSPQIYRLSVRDGAVERLTFNGEYNARGSLTPDGQSLVMVHQNGGFKIAVQHLKRRQFNILTETRLDESPTLAPNGVMMLYATQQGNAGILSAVSMDGRTKMNLPAKNVEVREPSWSPFLR